MKKFSILLLIAALLMCGTAFGATKSIGDDDGGLIAPKAYSWSPERTFRWVRYVPTGATSISPSVSADSIMIWDLISDDGVTVTLTTTSGDGAVAGVVINDMLTPDLGTLGATAASDAGKRNWGWLQTYGLSSCNFFVSDAAAVVGRSFGTSTSPGQATGFNSTVIPTGQAAGFVYDAVTGSATGVEVFIKCE